MQIEYKGKKLEVSPMSADKSVVRRKTASGNDQYYIRCAVTGKYDFRHQQAFDALMKKYGDVNTIGKSVISNEGKKLMQGRITIVKDNKPTKTLESKETSKYIEVDAEEPVSKKGESRITGWHANPIGSTIKVEYPEGVTFE